jgi:hypothetical protein
LRPNAGRELLLLVIGIVARVKENINRAPRSAVILAL